jgi:hypothetical protein
VNRKDHMQSCNLESTFHVQVTQNHISQLSQPNLPGVSVFITIPVIEWERRHQ